MKQVILRESSARFATLEGGIQIHLKPGDPAFLDDKTADAVAKQGWKVDVISMSPKPVRVKRPGIKPIPAAPPTPVAIPATDEAGAEGYHKCPDCDREFDSPQGLASHRRAKHKD